MADAGSFQWKGKMLFFNNMKIENAGSSNYATKKWIVLEETLVPWVSNDSEPERLKNSNKSLRRGNPMKNNKKLRHFPK